MKNTRYHHVYYGYYTFAQQIVSVIYNLLELFLKNKKTENGTWNEKKKKKRKKVILIVRTFIVRTIVYV